jgi:predicted peroxiredoxin
MDSNHRFSVQSRASCRWTTGHHFGNRFLQGYPIELAVCQTRPSSDSHIRRRSGRLHRAPFSSFARRGLAQAGHPPPQEKLRQLRALGARLYACGPSMEHFRVSKEDLLFDDVHVSAYPTFAAKLEEASVQIFT